jgi:hypothetical protein
MLIHVFIFLWYTASFPISLQFTDDLFFKLNTHFITLFELEIMTYNEFLVFYFSMLSSHRLFLNTFVLTFCHPCSHTMDSTREHRCTSLFQILNYTITPSFHILSSSSFSVIQYADIKQKLAK